jgi:LacI family transcriptional regulator, galactose operon repressor
VAPSRVTLLDVARRAGVSRTTASFVMTGRRDMRISHDAEQRVLQAARELNYRPNLMARGLRTKLTHTIGLVSDTIATEAFAGDLIRGSIATALQHQRLLYIGETEGNSAVEKRIIQDMIDHGVDGFLYAAMATRETRAPALLRSLPTVMVNCLATDRKVPAVVPDEREGGRIAARTLLDAGHSEHIHLVGERGTGFASRERRAGVQDVLASRGLSLAGIVDCPWWPEPAHEAVCELLRSKARPTGLICLNDRTAFGAYQAIQESGLRIPEDISIVSFDDSDLASWLRPQLTSVAIPHFELGRRAVELLLTDGRQPEVERVPMPLRRRASVGPPAAKPRW